MRRPYGASPSATATLPRLDRTRARAAPAGSSTRCSPPGRLVAWSPGRLVAWSPGRLAAWSPGRLAAWLDEAPPPEGRVATVLHSVATQLRPTLPKAAKAAMPRAPTTTATATTPSPTRRARRGYLTTEEAARRLDLGPARVQELARAGEIGRKVNGRWAFTEREIVRVRGERDRRALRLSLLPKRKRTARRLNQWPAPVTMTLGRDCPASPQLRPGPHL